MSERRARMKRQEASQALGQSQAFEPELVGMLGSYEMWAKGPVMFGLPVIRDDYPSELKTALDRRRRATLSGRCECGAVVRVCPPGCGHGGIEVEHEADCIASDDSLDEIATRHGGQSLRLPSGAFDSLE